MATKRSSFSYIALGYENDLLLVEAGQTKKEAMEEFTANYGFSPALFLEIPRATKNTEETIPLIALSMDIKEYL